MKLKARYFFIIALAIAGCQKDFLNKKPATGILVPGTLPDLILLIDNEQVMREMPGLGALSTDDYFVRDADWTASNALEKNAYIWASDIFEGQINIAHWNNPYKQVFYANVLLQQLNSIPRTEQNRNDWDYVKGAAHFIRGFAFFNLLQDFAAPYEPTIAQDKPGIPLRMSPEVTADVTRASLQESYDQVARDIKIAAERLPVAVQAFNRNRPSRPAAFALLSRMHLAMRKYDQAEAFADSALALYRVLINYNTLNRTLWLPFDQNNSEMIYYASLYTLSSFLAGRTVSSPDTLLYSMYQDNDLRKETKFSTDAGTGITQFKGSYQGQYDWFGGFATNELFLIKAECLARRGEISEAMSMLNELLVTRYKTGAFVPLDAFSKQEALDIVLTERRKELIATGLRWQDIRRFNAEGADIVLRRIIEGNVFELPANSPKYVFPIPDDEISLNPMVKQNPPR